MNKKLFLITFVMIFILSCNNSEEKKTNDNQTKDTAKTVAFSNKIVLEVGKNIDGDLTLNQVINIDIDIEKPEEIDSIQLLVNDKYYSTVSEFPSSISWDSENVKTGTNNISAIGYWKEFTVRTKKSVILLSDIEPKIKTYRIVNTYPHDREAYTQGLFIHDGILYEATGLKGHSTIRKTNLKTGEILQSYTISADVFGEGITLFENKIFQLSWQEHIAYVYDFQTFKQVGEFEYFTEGWGLTNDRKQLIMSDGTNKLYFIEKDSYSIVKQLEVYDDEKAVNYLNELEYIDGVIYANIYTSDYIAAIDAETGKILFYVDLSYLLNEKDYEIETDVLNGIAYDFDTKKLYVTGKKWPKLFEIQIL